MNSRGIWAVLVLMAVAVGLLFLPLADRTSGCERVIVDHTLEEIV